jgi:dienelactone hydrolase
MRRYHPAAPAASLSIPILVLQGGRDFQVGRADYDGWAKALGGHLDATLKLYPTLNHLFEAGSGPPGPEECGRPDQHVAEEVVADIAKCIAQSPARTSSTRLPPL